MFLRSYQLTQLFNTKNKKNTDTEISPKVKKNSEEKIGKFVKDSIEKLFNQKKLTEIEISNLMDSDYSKQTFNINYPILIKINEEIDINIQRKINGFDRYYVKSFGKNYLLCNDWYDRNRQLFNQWLLKINFINEKNIVKLKCLDSEQFGRGSREESVKIENLVLDDKKGYGPSLRVKNGLSDEDRQQHPTYFIGKIIEIEYDEKLSDGSYINPIFRRIVE